MKIYAAIQKGPGKKESEDRIVIGKTILSSGVYQTDENCSVIAVADGVGGNNAGAEASHFVANKICGMKKASDNFFLEINSELLSRSRMSAELNGMATTLSGFFIDDEKMYMFNAGNSRVYSLLNGKYLKQLTVDDTTLQYLISIGRISEEDADSFERKNEITSCFGGGDPSVFHVKIDQIEKNHMTFMLTSDGVHDYLSVDAIEDIIAEYGISAQACESIIASARGNGSQDDISVVLGVF